MANADRPGGFIPYGEAKKVVEVEAGSIIYPGDAIKLAADGQCDVIAAGNDIYGVALTYASAAGQKLLMSCDPDQLYYIQADESDVSAQAAIGLNADILATAGNSTYKASRMELDSSTVTSASSAQLNIVGIRKADDNAFGANVMCLVRINEHQIIGENDSAGI